jgi:hypothetical protein
MRSRVGGVGGLALVAAVLTLLYGPLALAVMAVALGASIVIRCYPPLSLEPSGRLLPRRLLPRRNRGHHGALRRRRAELEWALRDARQSDAVLRPGLTRTAESLVRGRTERGLDDDPATTRRLLGPDLSTYLASRRGPSPTPAQLDAMLARLEDLR